MAPTVFPLIRPLIRPSRPRFRGRALPLLLAFAPFFRPCAILGAFASANQNAQIIAPFPCTCDLADGRRRRRGCPRNRRCSGTRTGHSSRCFKVFPVCFLGVKTENVFFGGGESINPASHPGFANSCRYLLQYPTKPSSRAKVTTIGGRVRPKSQVIEQYACSSHICAFERAWQSCPCVIFICFMKLLTDHRDRCPIAWGTIFRPQLRRGNAGSTPLLLRLYKGIHDCIGIGRRRLSH